MKNSFAEATKNILTRKFGGTDTGVATPYLTGTFFIWFESLPTKITEYTSELPSALSIDEIQSLLAGSCIGVTIPGGSISPVEFTGLGGTRWGVPGNIDYGTSISLKFIEFSKTPILDIFHCWVKMIRDYRLGISEKMQTTDDGGNEKKDYASTLYYWTTSPDGHGIEYYACYDGTWPTKDPQDLYSSDVETVNRVDVEMEFHFDTMWHEPWVLDKCKTLNQTFLAKVSEVKDRKPAGA